MLSQEKSLLLIWLDLEFDVCMKALMAEHFGHHVLTSDSLNYYNYYYKTPKYFPASSHPAVVIERFSMSMPIWKRKGSLVDENQKPHLYFCLGGQSDSVWLTCN